MRITDLRVVIVGNPWKNWVFCLLHTDEGLVGLGEATAGMQTLAVANALRELKELCVGEDPCQIPALRQKLWKALYLPEDSTIHHALSGIDTACWDILAKSLHTPLYQMLGGKVRPRIRVYANGWYRGPRTPAGFAAAARQVVERGYTALKFDPFGPAYRRIEASERKLALDIVSAVRDAVGDDVDIMIEAHDRFSVDTAVQLGRELAAFRPFWLEAPVLSTDIPATNEVARRIGCPVASGERFSTLRECAELLAVRAVSIIQPETMGIGGISALLATFQVAAAYGADVAPHSAASPLCTAINVHVGNTQENMLIQECFDDFQDAELLETLEGYPRVQNGYIEPTEAPGLGVALVEEKAARYPYSSGNVLRLFASGWEQRTGVKPASDSDTERAD